MFYHLSLIGVSGINIFYLHTFGVLLSIHCIENLSLLKRDHGLNHLLPY
jgi:hypothetical protein